MLPSHRHLTTSPACSDLNDTTLTSASDKNKRHKSEKDYNILADRQSGFVSIFSNRSFFALSLIGADYE
jgi:hypothetical protein